jgi:putative transposase
MERVEDSAKVEVWRERLARQRRSGLSIAEFCRGAGVSPASFYAWRQRLGASEPARARQPLFVPVELTAVERASDGVQIELPGGAIVTLPGGASTELVATAIRAAMHGAAIEEARSC